MALYYSDILTNDDLFDDTFYIQEVDNIVYEVDCKFVDVDTVHGDIEIGTQGQELDGHNVPSEAITGGVKEVDLILQYRLKPASLSKSEYVDCFKDYIKAVKQKLENSNFDGVECFEKATQAYAKKIIANFENYRLYTGESMVLPEGMLALLGHREDGSPYMVFWKHGLEVKCFI
ncbi:translationally-controlled tumor protein [Aspergillus carlsbadensis]|nr:translationally-controlled tumor protein [Aspergillus carlsbadensis]